MTDDSGVRGGATCQFPGGLLHEQSMPEYSVLPSNVSPLMRAVDQDEEANTFISQVTKRGLSCVW